LGKRLTIGDSRDAYGVRDAEVLRKKSTGLERDEEGFSRMASAA
jgi:hypothetical protein